MSKYNAPWSLEVVIALRKRQEEETLHPYTCGVHGTAPLIAIYSGWECPVENCDYKQDWCWEQDALQPEWWRTH